MSPTERILMVLRDKFEEQAKLAQECGRRAQFETEVQRYQTAETIFHGIAAALNKAREELK